MKFIIAYNYYIDEKVLTYIEEECSFYMGEIGFKVDVELILNKISLSISSNKIVHVSGFCGLDKSMNSNYPVPKYNKGIIVVEHNLDFGSAYAINEKELPVYINIRTGWVCLGDPEKEGNAVEFINNCVAVIGNDKEFISLWLRPQSLPPI